MPIQGLRFNIANGGESHQSFQSTGSFVAYNPNDGVANIALDRTATALDYDHKLPSQSGGKFPGPINSYLSIFYVDQSGGGVGGQVIIYATPEPLNVPDFWSIGRASQSAGTILDISQGNLPQNPPANTSRLWVDGSGHLHLLSYTGTDTTVIDTSNIGAQILGGDLYGTIANGSVRIRNNSSIQTYDSGTTLRPFVTFGTEELFWDSMGGGFRWVNQGNTVEWMRLNSSGLIVDAALTVSNPTLYLPDGNHYLVESADYLYLRFANGLVVQTPGGAPAAIQSGTLTVNGSALVTGRLVAGADSGAGTSGDVTANRGGNVGVYYFGNGSQYLYWTGGQFILQSTGAFQISSGTIYLGPSGATANIITTSGGNIQIQNNLTLTQLTANGGIIAAGNGSSGAGGLIYFHPNLTVYGYLTYPYYTIQNMGLSLVGFSSGSAYLAPNTPAGNGEAYAWYTYSSVEHAKQYGLPIAPITDPVSKLHAISAYHYQHTNFETGATEPVRNDKGDIVSTLTYGMSAQEVYQTLPELVHLDDKGEPSSIDYSRLVSVLWEACQDMELRLAKLEGTNAA